MRALTIHQPWADAITHGTKRIENRRWPTSYRGPLAIHAGRSYDPIDLRCLPDWPATCTWPGLRGHILATTHLIDCHPATPDGCCGTWAEYGPDIYHWRLNTVRRLSEPVSCSGRQRLWHPPPEVVAALESKPV